MKFIPMRAHESRVYFPNMAGGFDLYSVFVRRNTVKEVHDADQAIAAECAAFIVKACNSHEQLVTALKKIAAADMGEGGCYYTNRENILAARRALADAGIPR